MAGGDVRGEFFRRRSPGKEKLTVGPDLEVKREAPIFFLSYAHSRYSQGRSGSFTESNHYVERLFNDLSVHVSEMVPHGGSDPGFMDQSMGGGERWNQELLSAAGTCQVFLALISPPYVTSPWCAMEWDAFARRRTTRKVARAPLSGTAILPITWATSSSPLPRRVSDVQAFTPRHLPDPDIAANYRREGLYGLLRLGAEDAYNAIAWRLAQRIVEIVEQFYVEPRIPAGPEELRNVFGGGGDAGD